jgi:L-cysteine:1D-myo-inositol 2-amino-2-deoxy-alpha-D-glucopyranoside ligase
VYDLDGDIYFCRAADPLFGSVSGYDVETMTMLSAERGGDPARPGKKDPLDPLVWLARRPGEPFWDSRFGKGRPGWHVECSAIATRYLGQVFDVQAGGSDLIFPHHEISASHARVAAGAAGTSGAQAFARRYVHAGMVRLNGEKMSKSLGNLVFVSSLRESGTDPMAIRLAILAHRYRYDWDWTADVTRAAERRLDRWRAAVAAGSALSGSALSGSALSGSALSGSAGTVPGAGADAVHAIRERIADDLDAPGALAAVDAWADAVIDGQAGAGISSAALVRDAVDALLGIKLTR